MHATLLGTIFVIDQMSSAIMCGHFLYPGKTDLVTVFLTAEGTAMQVIQMLL